MPTKKCIHTSLDSFAKTVDLSWIKSLREDPEGKSHAPNEKMRPVRSGHYVITVPKVGSYAYDSTGMHFASVCYACHLDITLINPHSKASAGSKARHT